MKVLAMEMALQAGSDVWFAPDLSISSWTREIDWYLRFQIFHSRQFAPKSLPEEIKKILKDNEWSAHEPKENAQDPLALVVSGELPTQNLLIISRPEPETWLKTCLQIWKKAQKPKARLFLPAAVTLQLIQKTWPELEDITVVLNR